MLGFVASLLTHRQTQSMTTEDEVRAVAKVADELIERHPETPADSIRSIVTEVYHELDGAPIRDFVPPLVGHAAKARLRSELQGA